MLGFSRMNYRATRLLRLPGRTVQKGETVRGGDIPPYRLGSYLRLGMLVKQEPKKRQPKPEPDEPIIEEPEED